METGGSLAAPDSVRKLQTTLHAKAKGFPDFRFYSLSDKVWRADVLDAAWRAVRRNGGAAGVDGETVQHIEQRGIERWLGELARDLKEGTYRPGAVRQVLIPKKQAGKVRPLGIPCVRDRVAQTNWRGLEGRHLSTGRGAASADVRPLGYHAFGTVVAQTAALLVLTPIFEADLEPEQYAYREGRSAQDAVKRVHRLLNTGHREVVDADMSNYFGEIPHAELVQSVARRVSDGRLLGWIKAWLEMPVEEDDGTGGKRRTNRARRERKGTPQGAPISPLFSNIYMRRFILGWKVLGYARRFGAEIVNYADDFVVCGKAPAETMRGVVEGMMERMRVPINATKTRCMRAPEEPLEFLGYRIGRNYRRDTGRAYIGTRPSRDSVVSVCRRISELTEARYGLLNPKTVVGRLNRVLYGWANYFQLGQVSPAYAAVDAHAIRRLRQWLCRKHKVRAGKYVRFSDERLWNDMGLARLAQRTASLPWAKA